MADKMKCGCQIISDFMSFRKDFYEGDRYNCIIMKHLYQQYVNMCGNCENKAKTFNDFEKRKLNLAKEQFKALTEETVEEPEAETEPEP